MKQIPAIAGGDPVRSQYLVFGSPSIGEEEISEVTESLRSGWVGTGPKVKRFEEMFREYKGSRHAIAVSSCTAALHLSLLTLGIKPGDEVITTPITFAATANTICHVGARPVFADVQKDTMNIDPVGSGKKDPPGDKGPHPCSPWREALLHGRADGTCPSFQSPCH